MVRAATGGDAEVGDLYAGADQVWQQLSTLKCKRKHDISATGFEL